MTGWTKDAEDWGDALNAAAWKFIDVCPEKSVTLFNNCKGPLREAILVYAARVKKDKPRVPYAYEWEQLKDDSFGRGWEMMIEWRLPYDWEVARGVRNLIPLYKD